MGTMMIANKNRLYLDLEMIDSEIIVFRTQKAMKKACDKLKVDCHIILDGLTMEIIGQGKHRLYIYTGSNLGLIVHELSHVVTMLMDYYGFKCDEFRSYTLQYLVQETKQFMENVK